MFTKRDFFDTSRGYVDGIDMTAATEGHEVKITPITLAKKAAMETP